MIAAVLVVLPFASAAVLAAVGSWRAGIWINAAAVTLQFVVACVLAWSAGTPQAYLALLTALVAMTTAWFGRRDIAGLLAARSLTRRRVRVHHVGFQALVGGIQAATLTDSLILAWFALVVAVAASAAMTGVMRGSGAAAAATRLLAHGAVALLLALLGTLLLGVAPGPAGVFLLLGYGGLAGLVPLHGWMPSAMAEGTRPGAVILGLLTNVPLLLLMRMPIAPGLLIAFGLVSLLPGSVALFASLDRWRIVALAGVAQLGIVAFAIGIEARQAALLLLSLLTLARSAVLQSQGDDAMAWLALALLPLYGLYVLAGPAVTDSAWLLAPLAAGALLASLALLSHRPAGVPLDWSAVAPIWLQLALILVLAVAVPKDLAAFFPPMAAG